MNIQARAKIREFLQLNHSQSFHPDYLHRYLDLPIEVVNEECEALIEEGTVTRPPYTHYVVGVKFDWAAYWRSREVRPVSRSPLVYRHKPLDCSFEELGGESEERKGGE